MFLCWAERSARAAAAGGLAAKCRQSPLTRLQDVEQQVIFPRFCPLYLSILLICSLHCRMFCRRFIQLFFCDFIPSHINCQLIEARNKAQALSSENQQLQVLQICSRDGGVR
jgi:hypothetical protein